jgi:hypothetical protein
MNESGLCDIIKNKHADAGLSFLGQIDCLKCIKTWNQLIVECLKCIKTWNQLIVECKKNQNKNLEC